MSGVRTRSWLAGVAALAVGVGAMSGCRRDASEQPTAPAPVVADPGVKTYQQAESEYRTLVLDGVSPRDPRFEGVRARLNEVPADSKAHAQAQELLRRLEAPARMPERPLAVPRLADEESPCEPLAQALGQATEAGERERIVTALRDCRAKEEKRKAHSHPPGEGVHEGHGH